ncbi:MAG: hypothetical protein Devi2KO_27530 [Devosia indica]
MGPKGRGGGNGIGGSGEPIDRYPYRAEADGNGAGSIAAGGHAVGDVRDLEHESSRLIAEHIVNEIDGVNCPICKRDGARLILLDERHPAEFSTAIEIAVCIAGGLGHCI